MVIVTFERWVFIYKRFQLQGFHWKIWCYEWMVADRGWWLTRVAHIWRYLACEERPGELARSLGGPIQLYYISAMCLISYKSRLYFALVKSVLKLQSY